MGVQKNMKKVFLCNGMVRSGSTLQFNLLKSILKNEKNYIDAGFIDDETSFQEFIDTVEDGAVVIVKAHTLYPAPCKDSSGIDLEIKRLYIFRDIRDVAASLRKKLSLDEKELFRTLDNAIKQYNAFKNIDTSKLIQKYESLYSNIPLGIDQIANFVEVTLSPEEKKLVFEENKIESVESDMKKVNRGIFNKIIILLHKVGFKRHQLYNENLIHYNHISETKGQNGDWESVLTKNEIKTISDRYKTYQAGNSYV